ncbi:hypothetical protein PLESTF_000494700 [Pleodorina starrii]|nr:hypothetical protein PLESTF_000494700 [Pleodorina starrii]
MSIFLISSDSSYASPLALLGPPAPPLCIGTPMPLGPAPGHTLAQGQVTHAPAAPAATSSAALGVTRAEMGPGARGTTAAAVVGAPSCAAAALLAQQPERGGRLLMFADSTDSGEASGGGGGLPPSAPPEWRHLAAAERPGSEGTTAKVAAAAEPSGESRQGGGGGGGGSCQHFAAVAIPAGEYPLGVLSLGAEGPCRPACWTPEALHCTAAMLSAPLRLPQVDLACRALADLSSATTVHQLVRILLGAAEQLVGAVTRIETQARVAFLQQDVEAAAVFQSAATDTLGPVARRRLSEVLLVDTSAAAAAAGGGGGGGGPLRRSLGGTEVAGGAGAVRSPSVGAAAAAGTCSGLSVETHRDSFARSAHPEELPVCRGHSLPLKHTLLSEALEAQGTGLCIADCNAYVQDSKVYPRDLAVSRGSAPAQSLALATSCHCGKPRLALYATYHSILPQALLQTVVQELGQMLRALTPCVAAKVEGALAAEWGHLRHQLMESMRNRSLRSLPGGTWAPAYEYAPHSTANGSGTDGGGGDGGGCNSLADSHAQPQPGLVCSTGGGGGGSGTEGGGGGGSGSAGLLGLERSRGGGGGGGRERRASRRASFSLEAASSPRGSCKLAPLMATIHDRLKAAQAEQMANCRAASRMQDLDSIRILEQIGRGGYGVVYRGLYHGSEVAIKVIQEVEVAAPGGPCDNGGGGGGGEAPLRRLNSVALETKHLHDAIELVASVGMGGHPNIVQVLTFFTDVVVVAGDQPVDPLQRRLSGLDGVGELLRLTRMPSRLEPSPSPSQAAPGHGKGNGYGQGNGNGNGRQQQQQQQVAPQQQSPGPAPRGGGVIVLVQEFCDAGTLKTAINQRAFYRNVAISGEERQGRGHLQLNLKSVYSTLLEVSLALRHMHGLHMVHCDLKPQNVLLKSSPRDPRGFTAKLSDFGLAKMMAHDDEGQLVIDEAVGSGTLTHMAPESLAGQRQLTASIDMFAFGILMWQMVCGTRLYQGLNTRQIIRGVVREGLRPSFPAWVPSEYRRLAERCWHSTPSERPTAGAVVGELEAMVDAYGRAAASAASAAAAAWRPAHVSAPGPPGTAPLTASPYDSPGSPQPQPQPQPQPMHPLHLQHLQQLQQQQQQQIQQQHQHMQQQQQAAAAAAHQLYGPMAHAGAAAGGDVAGGAGHPSPWPQPQPQPQSHLQLLQQQLQQLQQPHHHQAPGFSPGFSPGPGPGPGPGLQGVQRAGSYTGGGNGVRPFPAQGLGLGGRLII